MSRIRGKGSRDGVADDGALPRIWDHWLAAASGGVWEAGFIFRTQRLAVFIGGCFFHGCPKPKHAPLPKNNAEFWSKKLTKNKERDTLVTATLQERGWRVVRIWECELARKNWAAVAASFRELIEKRADCS